MQEHGLTPDGSPLRSITIENGHGLCATILSWGGTLSSVRLPGVGDITLGFADPRRYLEPHPFFGCTAGRFANRIAAGRFVLGGVAHQLTTNDGPNHLHGGTRGFDKRNWRIEPAGPAAVRCLLHSPDGDEGYPGALDVCVTYALTRDALTITYAATTDRPTVVNLTNHAYWNLGGPAERDILAHTLRLNAEHYTVVDAASIPTGEQRAVADTAFDFRTAKPIGRDIAALKDTPGGGFDHNWAIARTAPGLALAAVLTHPASGRTMRVETDEPGIQFYSGNYIQAVAGHRAEPYEKFAGLCLETQHFPDAPNQPAFISTTLRPGETYASTTVYRFGGAGE